MIAIIAILAAILFPVFSQAKSAAKQTTCISNLRQLGTAFKLYASDYDDTDPSPGGKTMDPSTGLAETSPQTSWVAWFKDPVTHYWEQSGGIFPYVHQRDKTNNANSVFTCPQAAPFRGAVHSSTDFRGSLGGQIYSMNDYVRASHPGEDSNGDTIPGCGWSGNMFDPAYAGGMNETAPVTPAQLILLFESAQDLDGGVNRNGSPYFSSFGKSAQAPIPIGNPVRFHAGKSNFLFFDTHAKSASPGTTWLATHNNKVQDCNPRLYNLADYGKGGPIDLWDPGVTSVVYP